MVCFQRASITCPIMKKEKSKFKNGVRVVCTNPIGSIHKHRITVGMTGTIRHMTSIDHIGVEWDEYINGHTLSNDLAKRGHGWYTDTGHIDTIQESVKPTHLMDTYL